MSNSNSEWIDKLEGKFLVIDGPDRIGKSSLCERIVQEINEYRHHKRERQTSKDIRGRAMLMRFPRRKSAIGQVIDKQLKGHVDIVPDAQVLLFLADMTDAIASIQEVLASGGTVVSDRYTGSTYAYAMSQKLSMKSTSLYDAISLVPYPDINIFLLPSTRDTSFIAYREGFGGEVTETEEIQNKVIGHMEAFCHMRQQHSSPGENRNDQDSKKDEEAHRNIILDVRSYDSKDEVFAKFTQLV
jgi:thymidylate kinase